MPLEDLHTLPLPDVPERIRSRAPSPAAVLEATLERVARLGGAARSYVTVLADRAGEYGPDLSQLIEHEWRMAGGLDAAGLPLSLQLVGLPVSEALLCRAGHAFQQRTDWHIQRPPEP